MRTGSSRLYLNGASSTRVLDIDEDAGGVGDMNVGTLEI